MDLKGKVIRTASKMYGISVARSKDLVETAYTRISGELSSRGSVREEEILLFIGRMVLPCVN